jgi:hypothetical protein
MLCYSCGHFTCILILFSQLHHQPFISCRIVNICVVIVIFWLFFLYVLSVYAPCGPKIGLIKSYLILSYHAHCKLQTGNGGKYENVVCHVKRKRKRLIKAYPYGKQTQVQYINLA